MLTLRSFRDYPQAFAGNMALQYLSLLERDALETQSPGPGRRLWVLERIALKELVQRYCDTHLDFVPDVSDMTVLGPDDNLEISIKGEPLSSISATLTSSNRYVAGCIRKRVEGEFFSLKMDVVHAAYPFFKHESFFPEEISLIQSASAVEADRVLTGVKLLKSTAGAALGVGTADVKAQEVSLTGTCSVSIEGPSALIEPHLWYFEHHVLGLVLTWKPPHPGPTPGARMEEEPVLPQARHTDATQ